MKKEIPSWVFVSSVAVVVLVGGFFLVRAVQGPGELPAPKIKVSQEIPDHLKGKLSPELEAKIREQTSRFAEIDPNAPKASGGPTAPPSAGN